MTHKQRIINFYRKNEALSIENADLKSKVDELEGKLIVEKRKNKNMNRRIEEISQKLKLAKNITTLILFLIVVVWVLKNM